VNIASRMRNDPMTENAAPLLERHSLVWGSFLAGVVIGFAAVYIIVAQPLFSQMRALETQSVAFQGDLQSLVGVRNQAWEADNLLSDLTALKSQLTDARATIREIRQLRQDLLDEARHTSSASTALSGLARLQEAVLEQQPLTGQAAQAVEEFARIQTRLVETHADAPKVEETLRDIDRVRHDMGLLAQFKQQLIAGIEGLPAAISAAGHLFSLKDQLIERGNNIETARTQANRMFVLQDELTAHAVDAQTAFDGLDKLLEIKTKLADQTPEVADAVQNLEILSDFREELDVQIRSIARLREGLMEVVLLETTIGRVAKALAPLAQIANVRRLGDNELRAAARAILDNRSTRLSNNPAPPRELPRTAENDPFWLPDDEPLLKRDRPNLGAEELIDVPEPLPLPLTDEPGTN
jgi:hypothetical protein